ncbi:Hypothetical protein R9X50_00182700 [Acrodontium crateriforme]|uniref:Cytochrome b561 domain-containing protein n=1 Tax=Acrodontium crateriforme TaxID=150365 RepID=A0AAQ3R652_9PEZI|nr:Hypothetical protein R9X50_00182700 [Acrodontium crateriforme]
MAFKLRTAALILLTLGIYRTVFTVAGFPNFVTATTAYTQTFISYDGPSSNAPSLLSGNNNPPNNGNNLNLGPTPTPNPNSNGNWGSYWGQTDNSNEDFYTQRQSYIVILHAILATFAFGCLFPVGAIMIKLGAFNGMWWTHGIFQTLTYIIFVAAAVLGFFIAMHLKEMGSAHAIIGLVLVFVLAFQPFLGLMHHFSYQKHSIESFWTYAHIWIGRVTITLGIVNGGLGLLLATQTGVHVPSQEAIIAYGSIAGLFWFMYVLSIVYASNRRMLPGGGADKEDA